MALNHEKKTDKKEKPLTKIVIRRLPPTMTQEQFLSQVSPVPEYNYLYHVKGDLSLGDNAFSRTYINLMCPDDVYSFKERFDNYVFVDTRGHEYPAVVEFAPFQKIPKKRGKNTRIDPKCNTIETDSYYLEFIANLNKPVEQESKPEYTLQLNEKSEEKKDSSTPLLEYIKNKKAQKLKIRELRREERERRRREYERKKESGKYHDDRRYDEKSPTKPYSSKPSTSRYSKNESSTEKTKENLDDKLDTKEKSLSDSKTKERKYEDQKERKEIKPRFPKKEYPRDDYSQREYRSRHYDEYKKEDKTTKKVKKYSEKREERKIEAEQRKLEQSKEKAAKSEKLESKSPGGPTDDKLSAVKENITKANSELSSDVDPSYSEKDAEREDKKMADDKGDSSSLKRIRNKDRPTIPLYRPGMLSKRKPPDTEDSTKVEGKNDLKGLVIL